MRLTLASLITLTVLCVGTLAAPTADLHAKKSEHHGKHHKHHGGHHGGHHGKAPKGKGFDHILQVWFENQDFDVVDALPEWSKLAKEGILLTNFNAITHPSEPNYVAAGCGSNLGIVSDLYYNIPANITTIYDLLEKKGLTWKVYQEDIPAVGYPGYKIGQYVRKHNPAIIFDSVAQNPTRMKNVVPGTQLDADIEAGKLPNWMFYTPNMLNDAHDTNATYAGNWLKNFYQTTLSKPALFKNTLILITFDENHTKLKRNQVWSLLLGDIPAHLKGTKDNTFYTHHSTLNTVEQNWGLGSLGRGDADKKSNNVFDFLAKEIHYKNTFVPADAIPLNNNTIPGLLTGKSWNETHTSGTPPP